MVMKTRFYIYKTDHKHLFVLYFLDTQNETLLPPEMFVPNQQVIKNKNQTIFEQTNNNNLKKNSFHSSDGWNFEPENEEK